MKPEEQRIAIAEARGIKPPYKIEQGLDGKDWQARKTIWTIPDYLNDLNAMHEAEKALNSQQVAPYLMQLSQHTEGVDWAFRATSAQRAEAFLKTLNLWKD